MANTELIRCDYLGCDKPFAYHLKGFNLCAEHCGFADEMKMILENVLRDTQPPPTPPVVGKETKMPLTIYNIAQLRWTDRKGASQFRQGGAQILAKRLETLRCPARLTLMDGTVIGGCEFITEPGKRLKWAWWYDKDALISHQEPTRSELAREYIEDQRSAAIEAYWKEKQGDEYGSY